MLLETSSQPYTAFTVPGQGQFQWVTLPMGLFGCPASFQHMMEAVVKGLEGIIVYIFSDQKKPGGLGTILTQIDEKGEHQVIACASRKLVQHEKNYMPYLLEMQAAIWAMEHFDTHLCGQHFTLFMDLWRS